MFSAEKLSFNFSPEKRLVYTSTKMTCIHSNIFTDVRINVLNKIPDIYTVNLKYNNSIRNLARIITHLR